MKQAMILAAGLGTRLKPLTDTMPKAMVSVAGKPLLWHVVMKLKAAGYERVVVNVHHFAQQITDYLQANRNFGLDIRISDETGMLLETGGAVKKARPLFDPSSPILIHNVDILSNLSLSNLYADVPLLVVSERQTKRYLLFDQRMCLRGWTNIETGEMKGPCISPSTDGEASPLSSRRGVGGEALKALAFSGIHVFHPSLFPLMDEWPERFSIMDFYLKACGTHVIKGFKAADLRLTDVGKHDTLSEAEAFLRQENK